MKTYFATSRGYKEKPAKFGSQFTRDEQAQRMAAFYGWKYSPPANLAKRAEKFAAEIKAERARQAKVAKERADKLRQDIQEDLAKWMAGADFTNGIMQLPEAYARLRPEIEGGQLETTKGALVPLAHVKRAWPVIREIITNGKQWQANGHTITLGNYAVDRIEADGTLVAGCHRFLKDEVLRVGALIEAL